MCDTLVYCINHLFILVSDSTIFTSTRLAKNNVKIYNILCKYLRGFIRLNKATDSQDILPQVIDQLQIAKYN